MKDFFKTVLAVIVGFLILNILASIMFFMMFGAMAALGSSKTVLPREGVLDLDMSKFTLSPMPGLLTEVSVKPGQKVQAGERLAVIEAMKMENILFANADGVVKEIKAQPGESLAVDQAIIEFE